MEVQGAKPPKIYDVFSSETLVLSCPGSGSKYICELAVRGTRFGFFRFDSEEGRGAGAEPQIFGIFGTSKRYRNCLYDVLILFFH